MKRIITSLLENDMYKFSMGQAIYHQFSNYKTTWTFKCRNKGVVFTHEMIEEIKNKLSFIADFDLQKMNFNILILFHGLKEVILISCGCGIHVLKIFLFLKAKMLNAAWR